MKNNNKDKIIIYKTKAGIPQIDVKVEKDTVWLTQKQIAQLFDVNVPAISKHINNIYKEKELNQSSTISKMETVQKEGDRQILRNIDHYNLDIIVSVGYRVNSKRATEFRIWATNTLKQYLLNGYAINQKRLMLEQNKLKEIQRVVNFIEKQADKYLLKDKARELLFLVNEYARSLTILHQYDEGKIKISKTQKPSFVLEYKTCQNLIIEAKAILKQNNEASDLFGREINDKLKSILGAVYQTFGGKDLYSGIEEKAANLLYLIIKDHPFSDGNKRIASLLFLYFLKKNDYLYRNSFEKKINDSTLVSLALLVATSDPKDKEVMIKIIISLLQ